MRLSTWQGKNGHIGVGFWKEDQLFDWRQVDNRLPVSIKALLEGGDDARIALRTAFDKATQPMATGTYELLPPIPDAAKIICVGLNYADHALEGNREIPEFPVFFIRYPSSFVGHGQAIIRPQASAKHDYEAELAVVIGKGGRHIPVEKAVSHVAGYTLANDGSLRDFQKRGPQWTLGKNFDASGAMGPWLRMADMMPSGAKNLRITATLNGVVMQDGNTKDMIFDVPALIAALSQVMALSPGDIILTGTPAGVGFARTPPVYLQPGDHIEVTVEEIGTLANPVIAEE